MRIVLISMYRISLQLQFLLLNPSLPPQPHLLSCFPVPQLLALAFHKLDLLLVSLLPHQMQLQFSCPHLHFSSHPPYTTLTSHHTNFTSYSPHTTLTPTLHHPHLTPHPPHPLDTTPTSPHTRYPLIYNSIPPTLHSY